jgi:hypothetical protein
MDKDADSSTFLKKLVDDVELGPHQVLRYSTFRPSQNMIET